MLVPNEFHTNHLLIVWQRALGRVELIVHTEISQVGDIGNGEEVAVISVAGCVTTNKAARQSYKLLEVRETY